MPYPENEEEKDKFKKIALADQYGTAYFATAMVLDRFDKKADTAMKDWRRKHDDEFINVTVEPDTPVKHTFSYDLKDDKTAEKVQQNLKNLKKTLSKLQKSNRPENKAFGGYLKFCEKLCDTEAGDYGRAMTENPYLNELTIRIQGFVKFKGNETAADMVNKLGGNGPLAPLNTYYSVLSDLYDREYEKQKIMADYSPEKETAYLDLLNRDFTRLLENHPKIEAMVNEKGESPYDKDLGESLSIMTDKADRSCKSKIENIRGQKKAIDNKWGMNELGILGTISEIKYSCERQKKKLEVESSNETFEAKKQDYQNRIQQNQEAKRRYEEQLIEARNQQKQKEIDDLNRKISRCNQVINGFNEEINKLPALKKELEDKLKAVSGFTEKVNALHDSAMNKVAESPADKMDIAKKLNTVLDEGLTIDNDTLKRSCAAGKKSIAQAAEYGFMKPQAVEIDESVKENVFNDEMAEEYNAFAGLYSANQINLNMQDAFVKYDLTTYNSLNDRKENSIDKPRENDFDVDDIRRPVGEELRGQLGGTLKFSTRALLSDYKETEISVSNDIVRSFHDSFAQIMTNISGDEKDLSRCISANLVFSDLDRGNYVKAQSEQPYLSSYFAQTSGAPNVFGKNGDATEVRKWLEDINAFDPIVDFYQSGKELFEIEFEKQKMQKSGWDEKKEKLYLSKLHENYSKTIDAFEKLQSVPLELQSEDKGLAGNTIGEMTAVSDKVDTKRDINPAIGMIKWQKKAIENGASSRDLNVFAFGGMIEGYMTRHRLKTEISIKLTEERMKNESEEDKQKSQEEIAKCKKKLEALNKWDNEHFKPFKESILGRQIKSSSDMLNIVTEMKSFYEKHKDDPVVGSPKVKHQGYIDRPYNLFSDPAAATFDYIIPKCINNCMEDIKTGNRTAYPAEKQPMSFEKHDKSKEMAEYLKALRSGSFTDKNDLKMIAATYLKDRFLHGMSKEAHPEYFDTKHNEYKIRMKRLDQYMEQYAESMQNVLNPKDGKELADMLEFGNHGSAFFEIGERMNADVKKSRMDAFISGKPERRSNAKGLEECIDTLKNSKAAWGSSSGMYDNIVGEIKEVVDARKKIAKDLDRTYKTEQNRNFKGYFITHTGSQDMSRPMYDFSNPVKVSTDPQKLEDFKKKQEYVYGRINAYLKKKDDLIRKAGGDPKNEKSIDLLGKNGAKRYRAMRDAKKAILNQYQATEEFGNDGPTYADRLRLKKNSLGLTREDKDCFLEHMKCNINRNKPEAAKKNEVKKAHNPVL